jgi:hypothetical protein
MYFDSGRYTSPASLSAQTRTMRFDDGLHEALRARTHAPRTHQQYEQACFKLHIQVAVSPADVTMLSRVLKPSKVRLGVAIRMENVHVRRLGLKTGDRLVTGGDLLEGHVGGACYAIHPLNQIRHIAVRQLEHPRFKPWNCQSMSEQLVSDVTHMEAYTEFQTISHGPGTQNHIHISI